MEGPLRTFKGSVSLRDLTMIQAEIKFIFSNRQLCYVLDGLTEAK